MACSFVEKTADEATWQHVLQEMVALREQVQGLLGAESHCVEPHVDSQQPSTSTPSRSCAALPAHSTAKEPQRHRDLAAEGEHNFTVARPRGIVTDWTPSDGDCYFEVVDACPYKHELGFPYSLGPFKLTQTKRIKAEDLELMYDSFETQPGDPSLSCAPAAANLMCERSANIMLRWKLSSKIKLPPGSGQPRPGVLSTPQDINLSDMARKAAGIPEEAKRYAWFHAIFPDMTAYKFDVDLTFLKTGGFVYLDHSEPPRPVHMCALEPDPAGGQMLFGPPKKLPRKWSEQLMRDGRFQPVSLDAFKERGATHRCLILNNEEFEGESICPKGGVAFHFSRGKLGIIGMPDVEMGAQCV